jgi:hypothetical protein
MSDAITTIKQARAYAETIEEMTGRRQLIFKVKPGTAAHDYGIRFGTCNESERADYAEGGAEFVDNKCSGCIYVGSNVEGPDRLCLLCRRARK